MRNIARNTLGYTGIVTLSQYIGNKKVKIAQRHNTGGNVLFEFLSDCLLGDFAKAKISVPTKIMLMKRTLIPNDDGKEAYSYESKSGFIYLLTKPEKVYSTTITGSIVRYSFIVSKDMVESINDFTGLGIGLFTDKATTNNLDGYSAFCELDLSKNDVVNSSLVVDWELVITNPASDN